MIYVEIDLIVLMLYFEVLKFWSKAKHIFLNLLQHQLRNIIFSFKYLCMVSLRQNMGLHNNDVVMGGVYEMFNSVK